MDLAMVAAAERHGELIAHFTAKRRMLGKAHMMRIRGPSAADEAWLFGDKSYVFTIADPARRGMS